MEQQRMSLQLILHSYACFVPCNTCLQTPSFKSSQQVNLPFSDKQNNLKSFTEILSRIVLTKIQKRNELIDMLSRVVEAMSFLVRTLQ